LCGVACDWVIKVSGDHSIRLFVNDIVGFFNEKIVFLKYICKKLFLELIPYIKNKKKKRLINKSSLNNTE